MVSRLLWRVDERRVSGVAVTRHPVLVVLPVLVCTVNVDREFDGLVTVEFRGEIVFDLTTPLLDEFGLDLLSPPDDREDLLEVVRVESVRHFPS